MTPYHETPRSSPQLAAQRSVRSFPSFLVPVLQSGRRGSASQLSGTLAVSEELVGDRVQHILLQRHRKRTLYMCNSHLMCHSCQMQRVAEAPEPIPAGLRQTSLLATLKRL